MGKKALFLCIIAVLLLTPGCAKNGFRWPHIKKNPFTSNKVKKEEFTNIGLETTSCSCPQEDPCNEFVCPDESVKIEPVKKICEKCKYISVAALEPVHIPPKQSSPKVTVQAVSNQNWKPEPKVNLSPQAFQDQQNPVESEISSPERREFNVLRGVTPPRTLMSDKKPESKFELAVQKKKFHYLLNQFKQSSEFNERNLHELVVLLYLELEIIENTLNKRKKKLEGSLAIKSHLLHNTPPTVKRLYDLALKVGQVAAQAKKNRKREYLEAMSEALVDTYSSLRVIEDYLADENQRQKLWPERNQIYHSPLEQFFPLSSQNYSRQVVGLPSQATGLPYQVVPYSQVVSYMPGSAVPIYNQPPVYNQSSVAPVHYAQPVQYHVQQPAAYYQQQPIPYIYPSVPPMSYPSYPQVPHSTN